MKTEWISVEDQMPETESGNESCFLLCLQRGLDIPFVGWYNKEQGKWFIAHHYCSNDAIDVTYWMPIPETVIEPDRISNPQQIVMLIGEIMTNPLAIKDTGELVGLAHTFLNAYEMSARERGLAWAQRP